MEHAPGLRNFLRRRLRSAELAEDLTQETFARALDATEPLREPERVRSYLYRTAWRLLLNHRRRPALVRSEHELAGAVELGDLVATGADHSAGPVLERELREALDAALAGLPADQSRAFRWAVIEQRSYAEIAAHTGWTRSKVKICVFRARQRVLEELARLGLAGEEGSR